MKASTIEAPAEQDTGKKPPLRHYVCWCQLNVEAPHARCGIATAGKATSAAGIPPMDLCAICSEMKWGGTPCQFCGEKAP